MAKIIVFEGADRCGKATQSAALKSYLEKAGKSVALIEVPIYDNITYPLIYWMLKNGLAKKMPKFFQWLQCTNRLLFQCFDLSELEHLHDFIIFDRWSLSSVIYGLAEGVDPDYCSSLYRKLRKPDFTFLLLGKAHSHQAEDSYESDKSLQENVKDLYAAWALMKPKESLVIDCAQQKEKITERVVDKLISLSLLK
jgi:dTMP kinase